MVIALMADEMNTVNSKANAENKRVKLFPQQKSVIKESNIKKGKKSEVYPFQVDDLKKMIDGYIESEQWIHYLYFVLGLNLARRVNDILNLTWGNLFNPATGEFNSNIEIKEQKTDKFANSRINSACRAAINLYIEKTGCDPSKENYSLPVFLQLYGTHKGRKLSNDAALKAIKKQAIKIGINYNVGTHSLRKTFGMMTRMLHPNDYDSMELLRAIYNHSDTKTTSRYIGLTKQKVDAYYDDMGDFCEEYVMGDSKFLETNVAPIMSLKTNDIRDIVKMAYEAGRNNANESDVIVHIDAVNEIMSMIEELKK